MIQVAYAIVWWLVLVVIGLIAFPLVSRVCNRLPDKGYSISKILGLLLIIYFSWLLASAYLVKFGYFNISISLLLLLVLSSFVGRKHLDLKELPLKLMLIYVTSFVAFMRQCSCAIVHRRSARPMTAHSGIREKRECSQ